MVLIYCAILSLVQCLRQAFSTFQWVRQTHTQKTTAVTLRHVLDTCQGIIMLHLHDIVYFLGGVYI